MSKQCVLSIFITMSRPISYNSAVTFTPSSYTTGGSITTVTNYPASNGYHDSGNTSSYARFTFSSSASSGYVYYVFDTSPLNEIPDDATINSVQCVARGYRNSRASVTFQLYNNSAAKGTATNVTSTSQTAITLTPGNWTRAELNDVRLRINGLKSTTSTQGAYGYFYGASFTVNYSVNGMAYEVIAESTYTGATVSPATQEVMGGESATVAIFPDDINNIVVEDNGTDVTDQLQYISPTPGTQTFNGIPTSYDSTNSTYDSIYTGSTSDGLANSGSTSRVSAYANTGANAESYMYYNFDCSSIPQDATITNMVCVAKASTFCASTCFSTYQLELCTGTTPKGTPKQIQGNGSTASANTIQGGSNWTRAELNNLKLRFKIVRGTSNTSSQASFSFWGASLQITYTLPSDPYYAYTLTNISADHDILVSESIIVPPEEDPTKTYYSVTISSINATTDPGRGTTRIESGSGMTVTITPSDPQITLVTDNGVDITNQLVAHGAGSPTSAITTVQGASYGFAWCGSTGYYMSQNKGIDTSAALCKVTFNLPVRCLITIEFINYAEATYDFGVFGNVDETLSTSYYVAGSGGATITDSSYKLACNTSTYNTSSPQTLTYEIPAGEHFIYIKYSKDNGTGSNNDTLQFKVTNIEELEANNYYTYTLSNVNTDHSLVFIFGDVSYYFVTSSTDSNAKLYPDGQMVELPGETYKLTIVPENSGDTITVRDNNVDVTSSLERKEVVVEKSGQQVTVVNYIYHITNVQTGHTVIVYSATQGNVPYMKINGSWVQLSAIYKKENGTWVEQETDVDLFDTNTIYINTDTQ